jgi:hypothetical protein
VNVSLRSNQRVCPVASIPPNNIEEQIRCRAYEVYEAHAAAMTAMTLMTGSAPNAKSSAAPQFVEWQFLSMSRRWEQEQ